MEENFTSYVTLLRNNNKHLTQTPEIEHLGYACNKEKDGVYHWVDPEKWYENFIGFLTLKDSNIEFGFKDLKTDYYHYPLYIGKNINELSEETADCIERSIPIISTVENPYILMFYGCDNTSYFLRFRTFEDLYNFMLKTIDFKSFDDIEDNYITYYYNS